MKKILIISILLFSINCYAGELNPILQDGNTIEKDFFNPKKLNIIDGNYKKTGYIEPDFFDKTKMNIYSSDHKKVGTIEQDFFDKNKWTIKKRGK